jgi:hypothetical protein
MSEARRFWFMQAEESLFDATGEASVPAIGMDLLLRGSLCRQLAAATLAFLRRSQRAHMVVSGRVPGTMSQLIGKSNRKEEALMTACWRLDLFLEAQRRLLQHPSKAH